MVTYRKFDTNVFPKGYNKFEKYMECHISSLILNIKNASQPYYNTSVT